jgi:hypothetical protein
VFHPVARAVRVPGPDLGVPAARQWQRDLGPVAPGRGLAQGHAPVQIVPRRPAERDLDLQARDRRPRGIGQRDLDDLAAA